jgi:L-alanine-DL-glutamate epimerase-like enolase superfamily enzyme
MRITDICETSVALNSTLKNSSIDFSEMTTSVVAVITDVMRGGKPVTGFAFNSTGRYACGAQMRARFIPRLLKAEPKALLNEAGDNLDPAKCVGVMMRNEKSGGHSERSIGIGTIEVAIWDAVAKIAEKPLHALLADRYNGGKVPQKCFVYVGGGWYAPGKGIPELCEEMKRHLDAGYTMVKMKIGGAPLAEDCRRIEAVLAEIGSQAQLAVDANGRFDLETAVAYAKALREYPLFWYEEAGDPLDYALQAALAEFYPGPMATGENLFSHQDARNLLRYGGMRPDRDWLQFDCALSYGLVEYLRTLEVLKVAGWSPARCIPHGGHQMSLNIAAGLGLGGNESYPDLFQPYGGFPDGVRVEAGRITMPELPGIGFEGKSDLIRVMRELAE